MAELRVMWCCSMVCGEYPQREITNARVPDMMSRPCSILDRAKPHRTNPPFGNKAEGVVRLNKSFPSVCLDPRRRQRLRSLHESL